MRVRIIPAQVHAVGTDLTPAMLVEAVKLRDARGNDIPATVTLSADHRVSDGRQAARFIAEFEDLMQRPEDL